MVSKFIEILKNIFLLKIFFPYQLFQKYVKALVKSLHE